MKQLMILLVALITSCTSQQSTKQRKNENENEKTVVTVPPNNNAKWKADDATKKNVAAMAREVNDTAYAEAFTRKQLYTSMQTKIDSLVKQCNMKGAEHDALHVWLVKVLKDVKELKEGGDEYNEAYTALKKDVQSFYDFFE